MQTETTDRTEAVREDTQTKHSRTSSGSWAKGAFGNHTFEEFVAANMGQNNPIAQKLIDRCAFVASQDALEREKAILHDRQRMAEMNRQSRLNTLIAASGMRYKYADFDTNDDGQPFEITDGNRSAVNICQQFGASYKPGMPGVCLWGPASGIGKTYLVCAAASQAMQRGYSVRFLTFSTMLVRIKDSYQVRYSEDDPAKHTTRAVVESFVAPDILIIDDLGAEKIGSGDNGDWTREQLMTVIERRVESSRAICVTTNLTGKELIERYGQRIISRLLDKRVIRSAQVQGTDYRLMLRT